MHQVFAGACQRSTAPTSRQSDRSATYRRLTEHRLRRYWIWSSIEFPVDAMMDAERSHSIPALGRWGAAVILTLVAVLAVFTLSQGAFLPVGIVLVALLLRW